jgi:molecular chaperone DnaK
VTDHRRSKVQSTYGVGLASDAAAVQRVGVAAEKANLDLSSNDRTSIIPPFLTVLPDGTALHLDTTLSRAELERMSEDLLLSSPSLLTMTLPEARAQAYGVDRVVVIGGLPRMPMLIEFMGAMVDRDPRPDAASGQLAIRAVCQAVAHGDAKRFRIRDCAVLGLLVEADESTAARLIEPNALPALASVIVATVVDNHASLSIHACQWSAAHGDARDIGTGELSPVMPAPAGFPQADGATKRFGTFSRACAGTGVDRPALHPPGMAVPGWVTIAARRSREGSHFRSPGAYHPVASRHRHPCCDASLHGRRPDGPPRPDWAAGSSLASTVTWERSW